MKVAIISTRAYESARVRGEGLLRMFRKIGITARIVYGLGTLVRLAGNAGRRWPASTLEKARDRGILRLLSRFDLFIICGYMRPAFLPGRFGIEVLRHRFPKTPLVLYTVSYLGSSPDWMSRMKKAGGFTVDRYDWHLVVSPVGKQPIPADHPCQAVGINLEVPGLYPPHKKRFTALLDHAREGFENERALQMRGLEATGVPFEKLTTPLSFTAIYRRYRRSSIYFLSFLESFGIPICETQLCGNFVFTPAVEWPQAHRIPEPFRREGRVILNENFFV